MTLDFTIKTYKRLLNALSNQGFSYFTFEEYISDPVNKTIILRHDVDRLPGNSLDFAEIEAGMGIRGTYYFRIVTGSFDEKVIREIYSLGHEVGYHYEDVSLEAERQKKKNRKTNDLQDRKTARPQDKGRLERELAEIAILSFSKNLQRLRELAPVKTICNHGSPTSRWDSRLLWKYYDYHDFGIVGEPYFDVNFDEVLYLTDTGRRWDGNSMNVRDKAINRKGRKVIAEDAKIKISPSHSLPSASAELRHFVPCLPPSSALKFHSTFDIIKAAEEGRLSDRIMMTFHPQRWTDRPVPWVKELVWQNIKNAGKYFLIRMRSDL